MSKKKIDELKNMPKKVQKKQTMTPEEQIESLRVGIALAQKMLADAKRSAERRNENK